MNATTNIPVFFATDDNYAPFLGVAIHSLTENLAHDSVCTINVLTAGLSAYNRSALRRSVKGRSTINFIDVSDKVKALANKLHLRDYYTKATYYRFFIADLFPEYDKALYLDCDIVITGDVTELYNTPLGGKLVGAIQDELIQKVNIFGKYSENVLNIPRTKYFNAGVLVMNLAEFRRRHIEEEFVNLLGIRKFDVAQDKDYHNTLCYGSTVPVGIEWNKNPFINPAYDHSKTPKLVHYKINWRPWHHRGIMYEDIFWSYAERNVYFRRIKKVLRNYSDEEKLRDKKGYDNLVLLAARQSINAKVTYIKERA